MLGCSAHSEAGKSLSCMQEQSDGGCKKKMFVGNIPTLSIEVQQDSGVISLMD